MYRLYLFLFLWVTIQTGNAQCPGDLVDARFRMYSEVTGASVIIEKDLSNHVSVSKIGNTYCVSSTIIKSEPMGIFSGVTWDGNMAVIDASSIEDPAIMRELMCYFHLSEMISWLEDDLGVFINEPFDLKSSWISSQTDLTPGYQNVLNMLEYSVSSSDNYHALADDAFTISNGFAQYVYSSLVNERINVEGVDFALGNYIAQRYLTSEMGKIESDTEVFKKGGTSNLITHSSHYLKLDLGYQSLFNNGKSLYDTDTYYNMKNQAKSIFLASCLFEIARNTSVEIVDDIVVSGLYDWEDSLGIQNQSQMAAEIYKQAERLNNEEEINLSNQDLCIMFETFYQVYGEAFREALGFEHYTTCAGYRKVPIVTYFDIDGNAEFNGDDYYLQDIKVSISDELDYISLNNERMLLTQEEGELLISVDASENPDWTVTTADSYSISLDSNYVADTLWFGLKPKDAEAAASLYVSSDILRCNESSVVRMIFKNTGNVPLQDLSFNLQLDAELNLGDVDYSKDQLRPGQSIMREVNIIVPGPEEFTLGESLNFEASVTYVYDDEEYTNNTEYSDIVVCSYDPNDKQVNPNREGNMLYEGEPLHYTIRFQNTGNAEAYQVEVRDTLDSNLDWSTMRILASSHSDILSTTITEDGAVSFLFADIFLPDSLSNPEGSQGYVAYEIQQKQGLSLGTEINNTASIYFDYNPPIVTNTTQSILSEPNAVEEVEGIACFYPNPNAGEVLHIQLDEIYGEATVEIYSIKGDYITGASTDNITEGMDINVSSLSAGTYLVLVRSEAGVFREMLVKR